MTLNALKVLILIVMEYALRYLFDFSLRLKFLGVLILIVMEYALRSVSAKVQ